MAKTPDEKKNPAPEKNDALESFLSREQEPVKDGETPAKKKLSRGSIALITAIIAVAALICVVVVIVNRPVTSTAESDALIEKPAELATTVDEKGEHQIEVPTDEEGEIIQNGYGDLVSYVPAQIVKIEVENTAGSFTVNAETPEGEATIYTVTGLEGFELRESMADSVANDAASLSFTTVAAVGGNLADFGLDKPRATVRVTYNDNTTATIRVGNPADGGVGTYAALGDSNDIFLVADDAVDSFLYSVLEMVSYEITPKAESVDNDAFSVIELTGAHYPDPITIVPNTDEAIKSNYRLTAPYEMFADSYECNDISGSIRDLYAESVVCVNPSDGQLAEFGVAQPYARVYAEYPDIVIDLSCSGPTDDGLVNIYNPSKGVIYTIRLDALGWANSDMDQLLPKTVIELNKSAVRHITVNSGAKSYSLDVSVNRKTEKNDSGDEETVETYQAKLDGKKISEDAYSVFFRNFNIMNNLGAVNESGTHIVYEWRVSYNTGRADDVISVYELGDKCPVALNGILIGSVSKSHAASLQQDILDLKNNKIPNSL